MNPHLPGTHKSHLTPPQRTNSDRNPRPNNPKQRRSSINVLRLNNQRARGTVPGGLVRFLLLGVARRGADSDSEDSETAAGFGRL